MDIPYSISDKLDDLEKSLRDQLKEVKLKRTYLYSFFPREIIDELKSPSVSIYLWDYSKELEVSVYSLGDNDAEKLQMVLQTIKFLEKSGFEFSEKPQAYEKNVFWKGKLKDFVPTEQVKSVSFEISQCPIPPGCKLEKVLKEVPEHIEPAKIVESYKVVCLSTNEEL